MANHLRRHVPRSTACVLAVVIPHLSRNSEVSNADIAIIIEHEVLRLQVSVNNSFGVEVLQANDNVRNEEFSLRLVKLALASYMIPQIAPVKVVHD